MSSISGKERLYVAVGVERFEVVELLADADELHRQAELLLDGEDGAALGRAVALGQDDPATLHAFLNCSAWAMAFWPVVASRTSSASCGAPGICLLTTRWIFSSSRIRWVWVCSRPAVSTMSTSCPRARARAQASWATLAGSLPCRFL